MDSRSCGLMGACAFEFRPLGSKWVVPISFSMLIGTRIRPLRSFQFAAVTRGKGFVLSESSQYQIPFISRRAVACPYGPSDAAVPAFHVSRAALRPHGIWARMYSRELLLFIFCPV